MEHPLFPINEQRLIRLVSLHPKQVEKELDDWTVFEPYNRTRRLSDEEKQKIRDEIDKADKRSTFQVGLERTGSFKTYGSINVYDLEHLKKILKDETVGKLSIEEKAFYDDSVSIHKANLEIDDLTAEDFAYLIDDYDNEIVYVSARSKL